MKTTFVLIGLALLCGATFAPPPFGFLVGMVAGAIIVNAVVHP